MASSATATTGPAEQTATGQRLDPTGVRREGALAAVSRLRAWLHSGATAPAAVQLRPGVTVVDAERAAQAALRDLERWQHVLDTGTSVARARVEALVRVRTRDVEQLLARLAA